MQEICGEQTGWHQPILENLQIKINTYPKSLSSLKNEFKIQRCYSPNYMNSLH